MLQDGKEWRPRAKTKIHKIILQIWEMKSFPKKWMFGHKIGFNKM